MGRRRVHDRGGDPEGTEEHRFQGIAEHDESNFIFDLAFFSISRSKNVILVQLTLAEGRTLEQKRGFYKRVGTEREDWSFGNGVVKS